MRKLIGLIVLLSVFCGCNLNGKGDKYSIEGTIKNYPSAKSVILERLGLQKITTVDSAKLDDKGAFVLKGVAEDGFYRIKLDDKTSFLFFLEPVSYKMDIDMAKQQDNFTATGSKTNDEFQADYKRMNAIQQELNGWNMAYKMYGQQGASSDTMMFIQQQFQMAAGKFEAIVRDSSKSAHNPLIAMFYVTNGPFDKFPKENLAVLQRMEKEIPNSSYTKDLRAAYNDYEKQAKTQEEAKNNAANVDIGKTAPEIDLKNPQGKDIKLSSLKGKVVLVDFWASWCGPCRKEMPNVVAAYNKYKNKGFTVYSVSLDKDSAAWINAIGALGMTWENHVSDLKWWQCEAALKYGVQGIPAAFLLDKNGVIVATNLRGEDLDKKDRTIGSVALFYQITTDDIMPQFKHTFPL